MQKSLQNIFVPVSRKRSLQLKPIYFLFVGLTPDPPGQEHFLGASSVVTLVGAQRAGRSWGRGLLSRCVSVLV